MGSLVKEFTSDSRDRSSTLRNSKKPPLVYLNRQTDNE